MAYFKNCCNPAADVVGYSRLAGADEDRTLARLARCAAT